MLHNARNDWEEGGSEGLEAKKRAEKERLSLHDRMMKTEVEQEKGWYRDNDDDDKKEPGDRFLCFCHILIGSTSTGCSLVGVSHDWSALWLCDPWWDDSDTSRWSEQASLFPLLLQKIAASWAWGKQFCRKTENSQTKNGAILSNTGRGGRKGIQLQDSH